MTFGLWCFLILKWFSGHCEARSENMYFLCSAWLSVRTFEVPVLTPYTPLFHLPHPNLCQWRRKLRPGPKHTTCCGSSTGVRRPTCTGVLPRLCPSPSPTPDPSEKRCLLRPRAMPPPPGACGLAAGMESQVCSLLIVWSWAGHVFSLSLSFPSRGR